LLAARKKILGAALALTCARAPEPSPEPPRPALPRAGVPAAPATSPAFSDDPPRRSCPASVAPSEHPLARALHRAEIGERTFVVAWRRRGHDVDTVIVALDERGELVVAPLPVPFADSLAVGADAGGLVIVSVPLRGTGSLLRVALRPDGGLEAGAATPLPEVAWGWPATILSDGTRAFLRHDLATPEQTRGDTVLHTIDLQTRRVVATATVPPGATLHCDGGGCTTIALDRAAADRTPAHARLVHRTRAGGEERLEFDLAGACPGLYELDAAGERVVVGAGDPWRAVTIAPAPPFLREAAVDPALVPAPGCGPTLYPFASARHPGLVDGHQAPRSLLRWDPARRTFGARDALPDMSHWQSERYLHEDGVIEVEWTAGSGMQHSPTDARGVRRYYRHWYFESGQVALLRREHGRWTRLDPAPLPLAGASGTMQGGYHPTLLRHGLHAAVLLAPEGGPEDAWLQPYLAPCGPR
jgi:hypothetical protein